MDLYRPVRGLAAFLAALLAVGAVVAELVAPVVEFSVLVAIPAGFVAGLLAAFVVVVGAGADSVHIRRFAAALGDASVAFLVALVLGLALQLRPSRSLPTAGAVGLAVAVAQYLGWRRSGGDGWPDDLDGTVGSDGSDDLDGTGVGDADEGPADERAG